MKHGNKTKLKFNTQGQDILQKSALQVLLLHPQEKF